MVLLWNKKIFKMCLRWCILRICPFVESLTFNMNFYISTSELVKQTKFHVTSEEKAAANSIKYKMSGRNLKSIFDVMIFWVNPHCV